MGNESGHFIEMRAVLARSVARDTRPLTFVIGAGASHSSNGPTTPVIHATIDAATHAGLDDPTREHEILDDELREALAPLFAGVRPNSGYRLLAALGRVRRVNLVSLNWDDAMEQACAAAGVPFEAFDPIYGPTLAEVEASLPADRGVLIAHVHGTINVRPRYSLLETLPLPDVWAEVAPLLAYTTIICGASLTSDIDVTEAIHLAATRAGEHAHEMWHFGRRPRSRPIVELPTHWWRVVSDDVDWDALIAALAEECWAEQLLADARWDDLVRKPGYAHLKLPSTAELVELHGAIRNEALAGHVAALVARPNVGKTVGVLRLAHLRMLMQAPNAELVAIFDPQDAVGALGIAAKRPQTVVMIDDPFGQDRPAENRRAVDLLREIARGGGGWAYASSTDVNWNSNAGFLADPHPPGIAVPTRDPEHWYEVTGLLRLAGSTSDSPKRTLGLVHLRRATTPPEVLEGARVGRVLNDAERADSARGLLEGDKALARACVLVRMQHQLETAIPEAELSALVECDLSEIKGIEVLLHRYWIDGRAHWSFTHPTARQVTDGYLREHHLEVERELLDAAVVLSWIHRALAGWRLQQRIPLPTGGIFDADPPAPEDWLSERLATDADDQLLREIAERSLDRWETLEVAYPLVWVWNSMRALPNAESLLQSLLKRPIGCYALLESCLYYHLGTDDELWDRVLGGLWGLSHDVTLTRECLLALDAVCWRAPSDDRVAEWARHILKQLDPVTPAFGFVRFAAGYHPEGFASIASKQAIERDRHLAWTPEQADVAKQLVAWHFVHQSRARAKLHRYDHYDMRWLCQSSFPGAPRGAPESALALARSLIECERTSGWGFHLMCNLASVAGLDLGDRRIRELASIALERADIGDAGIVSAVLAYEPANRFRREIQARIDRLDEREHYLDALTYGVQVDMDLYVLPSRYRYIHDPAAVLATVGATFPAMDPALRKLTPAEIAEGLWTAARTVLVGATLAVRNAVAKRIKAVARGDLRLTTKVLGGRHKPDPDPFVEIVRRWREQISGDSEDPNLLS